MARIRSSALAHVEACRPDTLFYAGTVGLSGAVLTDPGADPLLFLAAWGVPTLAWIASLYGGDYFDRELDALTKPHRPVPSGRIRALTARNLMVAFISAGGLIALLVNPWTVLLAFFACVFGIAYASWLKGRGLWGNVMRGLPTFLTLLWGSMAVQTFPAPELLVLAGVYWLHDSGSNLLGALCDRDGDRSGGYLTYPVVHGDDATTRGITAFFLAWVALAVSWPLLPGTGLASPGTYYLLLLVPIALNGAAVRAVRSAPRPIPRAIGVRAHEWVVAERIVLGSLPVAAAGRPLLAAAVAVPSLALTLLARRVMRSRYEPVAGSLR